MCLTNSTYTFVGAKDKQMKTRKITKQKVGSVLGWTTEKDFRDGKYVIMVASYCKDTKPTIKTRTTGFKVKEDKKKAIEKMLFEFLTEKNKELAEGLQIVAKDDFNPRTASVFDYLDYYMGMRKTRLNTAVNSLGAAHFVRGYGYVESLRRFFTERLQCRDMSLLNFRREHLLAYFDSLYAVNARGVMNTASTVRHYMDYFLPAFRYAFDNYLIPNDITRGIRKPQIAPKEMPYLNTDEIIRFLDYTSDTNCSVGSALQALVLTGCRRSELLALRYEDIDYESRLIYLRRKVLAEQGGKLAFYDKMKNAQSQRTIPLSVLLETVIQRAKFESRKPAEYSEYIFCKPNGELIRPDELTKGIKDVCAAAGVSPINLHGLRHSFANLARQSNVAEEVRSALLGHSCRTTTGRYSNHIENHEKARAVDLIVEKLNLSERKCNLNATMSAVVS